MIFDSHAHLISSDTMVYPPTPLRGVLTPGEFDDPMTAEKLLGLMDKAGVGIACAVQRAHVYGYNNSYVLDCAAKYPERFKTVVVLDAADEATPSKLKELVTQRGAVGVRYVSSSFPETDMRWLTTPEARASWKAAAELNIPVCIHVLYVQRSTVLPVLYEMAKEFSDARVVVDHVGGAHPALVERKWLASKGETIGEEVIQSSMRLADLSNVTMKFSDINLEVTANSEHFISRVLSYFGDQRLIWGSDIGQSKGDYLHMVQAAKNAVKSLPLDVQNRVLYENAYRLYAGA